MQYILYDLNHHGVDIFCLIFSSYDGFYSPYSTLQNSMYHFFLVQVLGDTYFATNVRLYGIKQDKTK